MHPSGSFEVLEVFWETAIRNLIQLLVVLVKLFRYFCNNKS